MDMLEDLLVACQGEETRLRQQAQIRIERWQAWLAEVEDTSPTGEDPGYDDDFQHIREEVNKLSGMNTGLICTLAEKLLTSTAKDIRVVTYYCWARLQQDGEAGFAEGLELLAGLLQHYGSQLHPRRDRSRRAALEWLAGSRLLDSLSRWPEVVPEDAQRTVAALLLIRDSLQSEVASARPALNPLYNALIARLIKAGGVDALVPQHASGQASPAALPSVEEPQVPVMSRITSGQELLAQARTLAEYLREQPEGWLAAHRLMKSLRHDTLAAIPAPDAEGKTRIEPPRADQRAMLKRLYLQQSWQAILEQADSTFSRGAGHLWLDLQWYTHQALMKSGQRVLADIIRADLKGLLCRLTGLETLAFNDGTPFADEVTLNWIQSEVLDQINDAGEQSLIFAAPAQSDLFALEPEVIACADREGIEAALHWLQTRPGYTSVREQWQKRLLMARIAEQYGKHEMAMHLLSELDDSASLLTLSQWRPEVLFEVKARRLKLLRVKVARSEAERARLQPEMDKLLAGLIALDPARAAVLCN